MNSLKRVIDVVPVAGSVDERDELHFLQRHPEESSPTWPRSGDMLTVSGEERFAWDVLVPHIVHPLKVSIIEAMHWIDQPLSASDLTKVIDDEEYGLSHVSYHVVKLAKAGALEVVGQRYVRGSIEKFYFFR